jgi:hypothetical protein
MMAGGGKIRRFPMTNRSSKTLTLAIEGGLLFPDKRRVSVNLTSDPKRFLPPPSVPTYRRLDLCPWPYSSIKFLTGSFSVE